MTHWLRGRSLPVRVLVCAALATLAFVLTAGMGAVGALALRGDVVGLLGGEPPRPTDGRDAAGSQAASGAADLNAAEDTVSTVAQGAGGANPGENADETAFVHAATDANSRGDYTYLDHAETNGDPGAIVLAAPRDSYDHNVGVWYEPQEGRWAIFNQDLTIVPAGSTFEVTVPDASDAFVHRADAGNTSGNATYLDDPLVNGRPDIVPAVKQNWNPGGGGGIYNDHPIGVLYDRDEDAWFVYNTDDAPMPNGAHFNVVVSGGA